MSIPSLFVSHGAPTLPLEEHGAVPFLKSVGIRLGKPKAILVVSAHWESRQPKVTSHPQPETIHDFFGFPESLYQIQYPAPGSEALANRVIDLLGKAEFDARGDSKRGLDHGAWVPLSLMYPDADVPVVQLSIQHHLGPLHHFHMGRALAPLREEGVLILGSGSAVHNLSQWRNTGATPDWARDFDNWLNDAILERRLDDLFDYRRLAPGAEMAHPRDEHLLPLYVALGAGPDDFGGQALYRGFAHYALSMAAYGFGMST